jgi:nucleotide-binding universal stress UspA family protein
MVTVAGALTGGTDDAHRLYALRLVPPNDRASFVLAHQIEAEGGTALAPLLERADALGLQVRPLSFVSPRPALEICNVAAVKRADLVLLGWHKPVLSRTVLSGTVHEVMRRAETTVAVFVDRGLGWTSRVLVPYLGSVHDRGALQMGVRLARHAGANVTILQVAATDPATTGTVAIADAVRNATDADLPPGSGKIEVKVVEHSHPDHAVLEECAQGYDLVVIGVGPEWGLEHRSFGMRAERIIDESPASLLVVRQYAPALEVAAPTPAEAVASTGRA